MNDTKRRNLLVITVDCMRADFLNEKYAPAMTRFAFTGRLYTKAYANGCGTPDSFPAIFASRYSRPFAATAPDPDAEYALTSEDITLADVLDQAGYQTAAFVAGNPYLGRRYGYGRGFQTFEDNQPGALVDRLTGGRLRGALRGMAKRMPWSPYPGAERVTKQAIEWIERRDRNDDQPFFLWVHYMDAHFPTLPPGHRGLRERMAAWSPIHGEAAVHHRTLVGLYGAALQYVDREIDKLLAALLPSDTHIVLTADHGQLLGEHQSYWHNGVWQQLVRVPLIEAGPGIEPGRIDDMVELLDLSPHVTRLLQVPPPARWLGDSFGPADKPIYAVSNNPGSRTYTEAWIGPEKKVVTTPTGRWEYGTEEEPSDLVLA